MLLLPLPPPTAPTVPLSFLHHAKHRYTPDDKQVKNADIVVSAAGRAEMVKGDWIKPGAAVIDVGINSVDDSTKKSG